MECVWYWYVLHMCATVICTKSFYVSAAQFNQLQMSSFTEYKFCRPGQSSAPASGGSPSTAAWGCTVIMPPSDRSSRVSSESWRVVDRTEKVGREDDSGCLGSGGGGAWFSRICDRLSGGGRQYCVLIPIIFCCIGISTHGHFEFAIKRSEVSS